MDQELREYLDGKFGSVDQRFALIDDRFVELEARLTEKMRDMQPELLRGFEAFSTAFGTRLRLLEADNGNLNVAMRSEERLTQIEFRLNRPPQ